MMEPNYGMSYWDPSGEAQALQLRSDQLGRRNQATDEYEESKLTRKARRRDRSATRGEIDQSEAEYYDDYDDDNARDTNYVSRDRVRIEQRRPCHPLRQYRKSTELTGRRVQESNEEEWSRHSRADGSRRRAQTRRIREAQNLEEGGVVKPKDNESSASPSYYRFPAPHDHPVSYRAPAPSYTQTDSFKQSSFVSPEGEATIVTERDQELFTLAEDLGLYDVVEPYAYEKYGASDRREAYRGVREDQDESFGAIDEDAGQEFSAYDYAERKLKRGKANARKYDPYGPDSLNGSTSPGAQGTNPPAPPTSQRNAFPPGFGSEAYDQQRW